MIKEKEKADIKLLIDDVNNIALFNDNNYIVLNACKDALRLAYDLLEGKKTDNYLLKITTHQGKMQGINSLSTYKKVCDTCNALKDNKNAICHKCYADKTLSMYKQLSPVLIYNTLLLKYTALKNRQLPVINASYFRFEAFSDLQNAQHLKNLYKIARYNPQCRFALWTKNYKLVMTEKTPRNINLILSSPFPNNSLTACAKTLMVQAGAFCTKISPLTPFSNANKTRSTASSSDIIKRVILGSVMVIACPFLICSIHNGITLPRLHITLPYLVQHILVLLGSTVRDFATITFSIIALLVPIALTG